MQRSRLNGRDLLLVQNKLIPTLPCVGPVVWKFSSVRSGTKRTSTKPRSLISIHEQMAWQPITMINSLIDVNIVVADYLAPALDFAFEQRVGCRRRTHLLGIDEEAFAIPYFDDRRIRHRLLHRGVERLDNFRFTNQHRTCRCGAKTDAMCQEQTFANKTTMSQKYQQTTGVFKSSCPLHLGCPYVQRR